MRRFMDTNYLVSFEDLFEIALEKLVIMPDFPYRLLSEWVLLRDKFNLLCAN